jgi:HD-like signal output (HDOD) protein
MTTGNKDILSARAEAPRVATLLESAIRDIGIPSRPSILDRINTEMHKDEPDFHHLAHIIASDVGLGAGLISIANSPYFGFRGRARSVNEALMMLGLDVASRAIAGMILRKLFPPSPALDRFWHASAIIARLSGWLAQQTGNGGRVRADDAYTFGLFRDCGIPILLNRFPNYPTVLKNANGERELSFTAVEEKECPTNHAVLGSMLAQSWWLPEEICLAIRHHHDYATLGQREGATVVPAASLGLIATAQFSEHLLQHHTGLSKTQEWDKAGAVCLELLKIDDKDMQAIYEESAFVIANEV